VTVDLGTPEAPGDRELARLPAGAAAVGTAAVVVTTDVDPTISKSRRDNGTVGIATGKTLDADDSASGRPFEIKRCARFLA
jgi:hypothetical protein